MEKSLGPGSRFLGFRENKKKDYLSLTSQAVWLGKTLGNVLAKTVGPK